MRSNTIKQRPIKRAALGLFLAATLVGVAACGGNGDDKASDKGSDSASESSSASSDGAKPDLEGVPEVVATVNDHEISKDEFSENYEPQFQQASMQAQSTGQPVDEDKLKKQVVDNLVGTELLTEEADKQGFKASDADVDKTLNDLAKQNKMKSSDQFLKELKKQGMKEDDVREDLTTQVKVDQLIAKEGGNAKPTQAELKKLYAQAKAQQKASGQGKGKVPSFAKVRSQLVEQATSQKKNEVATKLVTSLRKKADVEINL